MSILEDQSLSELVSLLPPSSSILSISTSPSPSPSPSPLSSNHTAGHTLSHIPVNQFLEIDPHPKSHDAIILLYPHTTPDLISNWGDFHSAIYRLAEAVKAGGYLLFGNILYYYYSSTTTTTTITTTTSSPSSSEDEGGGEGEGEGGGGGGWDGTGTYAFSKENGFEISEEGARGVLESMGLEVIWEEHEGEEAGDGKREGRQVLIVRRRSGDALRAPEPLPMY